MCKQPDAAAFDPTPPCHSLLGRQTLWEADPLPIDLNPFHYYICRYDRWETAVRAPVRYNEHPNLLNRNNTLNPGSASIVN